MVAKITFPKSVSRALNYNEKKSQNAKAHCIYAGNFLKDADQLNFYQKLERFTKLNELNKRATTNTIHISLNFDPSEKLGKEKLIMIANDYMQRIGFGKQPYLVYQHHDAGHPHIHIISTSIQADGKRISLHNIGRDKSEPARKELEEKYELVKAESAALKKEMAVRPVDIEKVLYGKSETKKSITNILDVVINQYKYTSLPELNAILKQYNVIADRGSENSRIYKTGGLDYRVLNAGGQMVGVPIKASSIYSKPTLANLEIKFAENELKRKPDMKSLKNSIDWVMVKPPISIEQFIKALEKERIVVVLRRSDKGMIYGLTYIDYKTKSVFNGSDLGKQYSAKAIIEKCARALIKEPAFKLLNKKEPATVQSDQTKELLPATDHKQSIELKIDLELAKAIEMIMQPIEQQENIAYELKKEQQRKKKKRI